MGEEVVINGERWLYFSTFPGKKGLIVQVKVHPRIEEFMSSLGDGTTKNPVIYDNKWFSTTPGVDLEVYSAANPERLKGINFTINKPGSSLYSETDDNTPSGLSVVVLSGGIINLSFLRLKGISQESGLEFGVKDVWPLSFRRELKSKVGSAFRHIANEYIRPVRLTLEMRERKET